MSKYYIAEIRYDNHAIRVEIQKEDEPDYSYFISLIPKEIVKYAELTARKSDNDD